MAIAAKETGNITGADYNVKKDMAPLPRRKPQHFRSPAATPQRQLQTITAEPDSVAGNVQIMENYLELQYRQILNEVAETAVRAGRRPEEVRLVAVSKTFPAADIATVYSCGQRLFGESKIQELEPKTAALPADIEWHLIGHLQGNKAAKAVACADWIHSVDSVKLLQRLDRLAGEVGRRINILLEYNLSGEASKFGAGDGDAMALAQAAAACRHLCWRGLMTMAPFQADESELHRIFGGLRELRDRMAGAFGMTLPELSMGMSGDYHAAIAEGATLVRIGTAIFGKRSYRL
ncbi:MAG: YggS family pyridoxal phosphate-dependent enzyme [Victivallales bacterium]|nr:YggS family pyridoxal phosphate-dependent enzyme [Victivallales bacterium]